MYESNRICDVNPAYLCEKAEYINNALKFLIYTTTANSHNNNIIIRTYYLNVHVLV